MRDRFAAVCHDTLLFDVHCKRGLRVPEAKVEMVRSSQTLANMHCGVRTAKSVGKAHEEHCGSANRRRFNADLRVLAI